MDASGNQTRANAVKQRQNCAPNTTDAARKLQFTKPNVSAPSVRAKDNVLKSVEPKSLCQKVVKKPVSFKVPPKSGAVNTFRTPRRRSKSSRLVTPKPASNRKASAVNHNRSSVHISDATATQELRAELAAAVSRNKQLQGEVEQLQLDKEQWQLNDAIEHLQLRDQFKQLQQHERHVGIIVSLFTLNLVALTVWTLAQNRTFVFPLSVSHMYPAMWWCMLNCALLST